MNRRNFVKSIPAFGVAGMIPLSLNASLNNFDNQAKDNDAISDYAYWSSLLQKIAKPVLYNLSRDELKKNMPVETGDGRIRDRAQYTHLEAVGRTLSGMAPWLALSNNNDENKSRKRLLDDALNGLINAVNPSAADYLNFTKGAQPLVDGAFLCLAFLRAPETLWQPLDNITKQRIIKEIKAQRAIKPYNNNWVLFASINETFLLMINEQYDAQRLNDGINKYKKWYLGDGWYGDGSEFHFDYYNSYVMHPFLLQIYQVLLKKEMVAEDEYNLILKRMRRYGEEQERLISPEGTYPPIGRSITYRIGAMQVLANLAWKEKLPHQISPAQVRCALTAVMKRQFEASGTFDKNGWLQIGLCGHQPEAANGYISTGSLYLCTNGFLPLGLPPDHNFWASLAEDWTAKKAWNNKPFTPGEAI